jgi:hypothetical protein
VSALLPQTVHARPFAPQAEVVLPATQVPLEQQPPLQGLLSEHAELQVPLLQASSAGQSVSELQPQTPPAMQTCPAPLAVQLTQAAPPVPQAVLPVPATQVVPVQQPLGQLVLSQTHEPFTQC